MRQALPVLLMLLPGLAAAQAPQPSLGSITCAAVMAEGAPNPALLLAAMQGLLAARDGRPVLSEGRLGAMREALPALCAGQPERRVIEAMATVRFEDPAPIDLGTMTCAQLAPLWRGRARVIVPFLAAYLDGERLGNAEMDALAARLQSTCRVAENGGRPVLDVAKAP